MSSRQLELAAYRDAAQRALNRFAEPGLLDIWRFEEVPATAAPPPEVYLPGVKASDVILFIAGAEASEATSAEIVHATNFNRDVLGFILPSDRRSEQIVRLIDRVRQTATTRDVSPDVASFEEEVAEAVRVWLIRRVRGRGGQRRPDRLRALRAESRERAILKWESAGLSRNVATQLEADENIGAPEGEIIPTAFQPLVIVTGPAGSGKSLLLERAHQRSIADADLSELAPAPMFAKASDIFGSLTDYVSDHMHDLGALNLTGVALAVDGLDELAEARAIRLQDDAAAFIQPYPHSRLMLSSRHTPPERLMRCAKPIPPLSNRELGLLTEHLTGRPVEAWRLLNGLPNSVLEAASRPLFAIALILRAKPTRSVAELISYLIERCLARVEGAHLANTLLQDLAARAIDSELGLVPSRDLAAADQQTLLDTRLVYERNGQLGFTLRLIAEYAAAVFLSRNTTELAASKAANPALSDRWRTVFSVYLAALSDSEARAFVDLLAVHDPGLAYELAKEDRQYASVPWVANDFGGSMRASMNAYGTALDRLMPRRAEGDMLNTLAAISDGWLHTGWRAGAADPPITTDFDQSIFVANWLFQRSSRFEGLRFDPNLIVQDVFKHIIDSLIENRGLAVDYEPLLDEELWAVGTALLGRGEFNQEPIALGDLMRAIEHLSGWVRMLSPYAQPGFDADNLRSLIQRLSLRGVDTIIPPLGLGDAAERRWIWSGYTPEAVVRRRQTVLFHAMRVYQLIVDGWLARLGLRLSRRLLMPALVHERIQFIQEGQPVASSYWEPLPEEEANATDVTLGEPFEMRAIFEEARALLARRPQYIGRLGVQLSNGILNIWGIRPIRDTAYRWLATDLHAIGWSRHFSLPGDRA